MSYDTKKIEFGREPIQIIEIDLGRCTRTFGVSPCTASAAAGGECYNTRATCRDPSNYAEEAQTYRFCQPRTNLPVGINMVPSIDGEIARAPASITVGGGLGNRATINVTLNDHTWHDRDTDPYVDTRAYDPETTGTYWGKLLARVPYYEGRELRVLTGYLDTPFSWDNFQTEKYDITDIVGPNNGKVTITAKDILTRTYGRKSKYPTPSTGELFSDITDASTSATLTPSGIGDTEYPASGYLSIGREAIYFTRSGDALTLTRAQWGTEAKEHKAGDTVQVCKYWQNVAIDDVLKELLTTGAGIPASYIPDGAGENWDIEASRWLRSSLVYGILLKPEAVDKVISELCQQFLVDIWWSAVDQQILIKAVAPEFLGEELNTVNDTQHIIMDSVKTKKDGKKRLSSVQVLYSKSDYSQNNDPEEFAALFEAVDIESIGPTQYGTESIKTIASRWINGKNGALALASRLLARYSETPIEIEFKTDIKDNGLFSTASRIYVNTRHIQGFSGENEQTAIQITKISESKIGGTLSISGIESSFSGRYGFIAPSGLSVYSSESDENKTKYGFISPSSGVFFDGEPAYKII